MKKSIQLIVLASSIVFLSGCNTIRLADVRKIDDRGLETKLVTLEPVYEDETFTSANSWSPGERIFRQNHDCAKLFYREFENNLSNPYGELKGYIILQPTAYHQPNFAWRIPFACSLTLTAFMGIPIGSNTYGWELDARILDIKGRLIDSYCIYHKKTYYHALCWGVCGDTPVTLNLHSYKEALNQLIELIQPDIPEINRKLLKSNAKSVAPTP